MSSTSAEDVKVAYDLKVTCYATTVPTLALWTGVFFRIMIQKDKDKFFALIIICVLMLVSQIANIVLNELYYE